MTAGIRSTYGETPGSEEVLQQFYSRLVKLKGLLRDTISDTEACTDGCALCGIGSQTDEPDR